MNVEVWDQAHQVENVQRAILQSRIVLANIKVNFQKSFQSCTY